MIDTLPVFTVACPSCLSEFPIDPEKVPAEGVHAICSACLRVFRVEHPSSAELAAAEPPVTTAETTAEPEIVAAPDLPEAPELVRSATEPEVVGEKSQPELAEPGPSVPEPRSEAPFEDLSSFTAEILAEEDDDTDGPLAKSSLSLAADRFGKRDPHERARRLARVLVSDILVYYPARFQESSSRGTVKEDFQDEVRKSWKEYVDQVGLELAESTPYFEEALNEVLGKGEKIF